MPKVKANNITLNYEQQGSGEPLILLPFLSADNACYTFQVAEYAKHFTCISVDLRGTGESDRPTAPYSIEDLADDIAAFLDALNIPSAHITGLSLGGVIGLWLAAKYRDKVKSLSVHSGWGKTDLFVKTLVNGWQVTAKALNNVPEMTIQNIFPWCFMPELYAERPDYIQSLSDFVRSRPAQTVADFILQSNAVIAHDVEEQLINITAPTQISFGSHDMVTSTRFAFPMQERIRNTELIIFDRCAHAPNFERVDEFNQRTLEFLQRQQSLGTGATP
ncbi:MAG TPA: alpha/beta hydrolase [Pyrinomonadaceae bacterium]|jgi:pimeloyl-ACP methyl ester carboxylesterase|nr:alpha/beta hydrolase [Pyrinomonadaceae bacterium]